MRMLPFVQVATFLILLPVAACSAGATSSKTASIDNPNAADAATQAAPAAEVISCDVLAFDAKSPTPPIGRLEMTIPAKTSPAPSSFRLYAQGTGALVASLDGAVDLYNRQGQLGSISGLTSDAKGAPLLSLRAFFVYAAPAAAPAQEPDVYGNAPSVAVAPAVAMMERKGHAELGLKPMDPTAPKMLVALQCH